ncbi:hypothetical protein [uncultured Arsenicicoccus sp.]|nr:hypothetical protein [uncultured Arsenicicoccus sp.]
MSKVVITNKIPQSAVGALRAEHDVVSYHDADDGGHGLRPHAGGHAPLR